MANMLESTIAVNEFKLQSYDYIHFGMNTPEKNMTLC